MWQPSSDDGVPVAWVYTTKPPVAVAISVSFLTHLVGDPMGLPLRTGDVDHRLPVLDPRDAGDLLSHPLPASQDSPSCIARAGMPP